MYVCMYVMYVFYFWVLHPVTLTGRTALRKTFQGVHLYLHPDRYMFRPSVAIFRQNIQHFKKFSLSERIRCIFVTSLICIRTFLVNTAVVYLNVTARSKYKYK
jgi:hypothetical protein